MNLAFELLCRVANLPGSGDLRAGAFLGHAILGSFLIGLFGSRLRSIGAEDVPRLYKLIQDGGTLWGESRVLVADLVRNQAKSE